MNKQDKAWISLRSNRLVLFNIYLALPGRHVENSNDLHRFGLIVMSEQGVAWISLRSNCLVLFNVYLALPGRTVKNSSDSNTVSRSKHSVPMPFYSV